MNFFKLTSLGVAVLGVTACATALPQKAPSTTTEFKAFDTTQAEPFTAKVLLEGISAWDMAIDANETLWVSERADGVLSKIDPKTGQKNSRSQI